MSKDGVKDIIRTTAVGGAMQEMLTYGVPEIGWSGDPWITLCWNKLESRWEIWSERGEEPVCVHRSVPMVDDNKLPNIYQLCAHLRDHDLHKVGEKEILRRVDSHNATVEKERGKAAKERAIESLQKVYWHVAKEVGHHY
tara:strand:+ start:6157 stop:6576 length:420 start_codon:yes stop_codon:yes gene_type:complete